MEQLRYSSTILDLGTRYRGVVSFTLRPIYSRGLDRRLGGPPEPAWTFRRRQKFLTLAGNRTLVVQSIAQSLYQLSYPSS
jgi:hypothetical protein